MCKIHTNIQRKKKRNKQRYIHTQVPTYIHTHIHRHTYIHMYVHSSAKQEHHHPCEGANLMSRSLSCKPRSLGFRAQGFSHCKEAASRRPRKSSPKDQLVNPLHHRENILLRLLPCTLILLLLLRRLLLPLPHHHKSAEDCERVMAAVVSITVSKAKTCKGGSRGSHEPSSGATSGKSLASQLGFGFGGLGVEGFWVWGFRV